MKIIVTGGAGFIASHLTNRLIDEGHQVVVIDNLLTGEAENINSKAAFYPVDICHPGLKSIFEKEKPEAVFHHAAQVDVAQSLQNPAQDANINILGSVNIFENCRQHGVRKIIYASSAAVYGNPQYLGIDESHPIKPMSYYGLSKYTTEQYLHMYGSLTPLRYTILRYANVYGPGQGDQGEGGVVSIFIKCLMNRLTPQIFGDGEQTRDFIYVSDVVEANIKALQGADGQVINIGTNKGTSINTLLARLQQHCGCSIPARFLDPRDGDIRHSYFQQSEAQKALAWKPIYSLDEGLKATVESCQVSLSRNAGLEEKMDVYPESTSHRDPDWIYKEGKIKWNQIKNTMR